MAITSANPAPIFTATFKFFILALPPGRAERPRCRTKVRRRPYLNLLPTTV
jgi:hypothetical protein